MPDLSFHDNSESHSTSQDRPQATSLSPASRTLPDSAEAERGTPCERMSPERQLLLSLVRPEEQHYFRENTDPGSSASLSCLAHILQREHLRRQGKRFLRVGVAVLFVIGGALCFSTYTETAPLPAALILATSIAVSGFLASRNPQSRLQRAAFEYLLQIEDRRSVGLLLEQRLVVSPDDRHRVERLLIERLPQLDPKDVSQWTNVQPNLLFSILDYVHRDRDIDLRLAAISAVNLLCDRRSLKVLYCVAAGEAATHGEQAVRTAAQTCLHDLQSRLDFGNVAMIPSFLDRICNPVDNKQTVGPIIDADSLYALIALLPQLTPANYREILTPRDRDHLYSILTPVVFGSYGYDKVKLHREVVRTLERVGDTKAIKALSQIANMDAPTDAEKLLRTEAQEAWRYLKQLVEKEKVGKTLLRASYAPDVHPDELLRAATPAESVTDPGELLRASIPKQEEGPITTASLARALDALRRQSDDDHGV